MPTPTPKLLRWFAILVLPASLLVVLGPEWLPTSVAVFLCFWVIALADAALGMGGCKGLSLETPPLIRCTQGRIASLAVKLRSAAPRSRSLRLALLWPERLEPEVMEQPVQLSGVESDSESVWSFKAQHRGRFQISEARIGVLSKCGLWEFRRSLALPVEIRVYPNLLPERRSLAGLFLHRGLTGVHAQRQIGKGREFEKLREYLPGDGYDEIHWKSTAKRGHPVTKVFQLERTQEVYVIIDRSRLSAQRLHPTEIDPNDLASGASETVLDRYISAALMLGQTTETQGDLFGLVVFSDKLDRFVRAKNGTAHYNVCRDALYQLTPSEASPDYDELASFLRVRLRKRALLIYLSSINDPILGEGFIRHAQSVGRQHLMTLCMIRPPGLHPLFSDRRAESVDDIYQALGGHLRWQQLMQKRQVLESLGASLHLVDSAGLCVELVTRYLEVKQRQSL